MAADLIVEGIRKDVEAEFEPLSLDGDAGDEPPRDDGVPGRVGGRMVNETGVAIVVVSMR